MGARYPRSIYTSLVPIVLGVIATSRTDAFFDVSGLLAAVVSNVSFVSRNILSKPCLQRMDNVNLYNYMCLTAFVVLLPVWVITDGRAFLADPSLMRPLVGPGSGALWGKMLVCGTFHWLYNQCSILCLSYVSPLTHSVCNVMRRALVIAVTMMYFQDKASVANIAGIVTVFLGVNYYLQLRRLVDERAAPAKAS